jgi:DNA-binding response OmpR family regulator
MQRICIVEDSPDLQDIIVEELKDWYQVKCASSLKEARQIISKEKFDLILLDVKLPDGTGFEFCAQLKNQTAFKDVPIVFLTARADPNDKVMGFTLGADDYVVKPFDPLELRARIQARLRRKLQQSKENFVIINDIKFDQIKQRAFVSENGKDINLQLTPFEYRILFFLASRTGEYFKRTDLLANVLDPQTHIKDENIYTHISALRKKLGARNHYLECIPRVGYSFKKLSA